MAPINAEDYGSGDLDKHFARMTSLRIDTSKPTGMASRALEALGIADDDILKDADDSGKEDLFEVHLPVSFMMPLFHNACESGDYRLCWYQTSCPPGPTLAGTSVGLRIFEDVSAKWSALCPP
jgi:hypothetical protein